MPDVESPKDFPTRKVHRRFQRWRRTKLGFSRPFKKKKPRRSTIAKQQTNAGRRGSRRVPKERMPKQKAPTMMEVVLKFEELLGADGGGRSEALAYLDALFWAHPRLHGRLVARALGELIDEEEGT